jgi:F-type H+-transporting ATPase subunit b
MGSLKTPDGLVRVAAAAVVAILVTGSGLVWAAAGGDAAPGAHGGFSSTDWFRVMNFVVLAGALFLLLRKAVPRALNSRIKGIQEQLSDLEAKKAAAETRLAECTQKLGALEQEAARIMADYVRQGQDAKARILKEAEVSAEKVQLQARRNIEHEFQQAKAQLQRDIFESSLARAEDLLRKTITAQDQQQLVEDYLQKVVRS